MGKHPHVQFVLLNRVPWDVILDGSHLASAAEEERRGKNNRKRGSCLAVSFLRYKIERGSDAGSDVKKSQISLSWMFSTLKTVLLCMCGYI